MYHTVEGKLKRIAIISENLSLPLDEGFKKASFAIASSMAAMGKEIQVFTRKPEKLPLAAGPLPRNKLLLGRHFRGSLRAFRPEVILYIPQSAGTFMSLLRADLLRWQSGGIRVVLMSLQKREFPGIFSLLGRGRGPDLVLVLSRMSRHIMECAGFETRLVPLGVDTGLFRPPEPEEKQRLRDRYDLGSGKVLLHVGHISAGRNLAVLRRIATPDCRVAVVASTSTRHHGETAKVLKASSIIVIDHFIENIEEIYRLADGYVFPTVSHMNAIEIPLSVLEAMATNLPVATTAFGGIPDLFEEADGLFVCHTEEELIRKARRMVELEAVGTREMVLGLSWDKVAGEIAEAIETAIR
jgi:glycosyltransferase involved in cell wall biosynthesis